MEKIILPKNENSKQVSNSKNVNAMCTNELKKELKKQESQLSKLIKSNTLEAVINVQREAVNDLKSQIEKADRFNKEADIKLIEDAIPFEVVNEETGERTVIRKRIGLVKNNRPIDSKRVDGFMALINKGKYEKAYPIIVVEATSLVETDYILTDVRGREINAEESENFYIILDGQHRSVAFGKLNAAVGESIVPNVHVKEVENIGEYLVDINSTGKSWNTTDRFVVAALTSNEELIVNIAELVLEGFNPSTAALIYIGKKITDRSINTALKNEEIKLPKNAKVDIERGNKFVNLCKAAGIEVKYITKRYLINGFNSYATSISDEKAFEALSNLNKLNLADDELKAISTDTDFIEILKRAV